MEVYLNVIEMGPCKFGVGAAAKDYFGVSASALSREQAALIAACLPNPKKYSVAKPGAYMKKRQSQIARLMRLIGDDYFKRYGSEVAQEEREARERDVEEELKKLPDDEVFSITAKTRIYHADLLKAAREFGGAKKLADYLGIKEGRLSEWIRLKRFPSLVKTTKDGVVRTNLRLMKKWPDIERKLYEITGKTIKELFPQFVRVSGLLESKKVKEETREITSGMMLKFENKQLNLENKQELRRSKIESLLKRLSAREAEILRRRFGLDGEPEDLEKCAKRFGVTRERIRQIERKAIARLQRICSFEKFTDILHLLGEE
jgi:transcriptional regulator with XRE-family HTH domain